MENEDKFSLTLDGDDEVVEEEVIERDEEYDDDSEDEEYDDYEDEEGDGYDEEYDDYDGEEDYDDGYNDDYYDDRLNKVLDEIAEIKRGMAAPSTAVQQPIVPPPQYVYQPSAPPAGSEVVMYNEISRLRDELAKNQSSLEMQKEITRIKEDMARDQKFAESQYNAEIKRLQDKIEDLLKNASSPQGELPPAQSQERLGVEGGKQLDFEKLLSINEAVLRATRDGDVRVQNEIAQLKKKVDELPSPDDFGKAVEEIKKLASNADGEAVAKLSEEVKALGAALGDKNVPAQPQVIAVECGGGNGGSDMSELLRQLYEIKNAIGSSSAAAVKRTQLLLELLGDYRKLDFDVRAQNVTIKDKLVAVYGFGKKLTDSNEPDTIDLIEATNGLIGDLAATPLSRSTFADLVSFGSETGTVQITPAMRDGAEHYFGLCEKLATAPIDKITEYLPDLVAELNSLEGNRKEKENADKVGEITAALLEEKRNDKAIAELVASVCAVKVSDIVSLPLIDKPNTYKPSHSASDDSIFTKLSELKAAIEQNAADHAVEKPVDDKAEEPEKAEEAPAPKAEAANEESDASASVAAVLDAVDELRSKLEAATMQPDISSALEELRNDYLDISEKLVAISERIAEPVVAAQTEIAPEASALSDEDKQKMIDDLGYIRGKLDDYGAFITQISDLRSDILNISNTIDFTEQFNNQLTEITAQFDKLYEDLSNVIIESEANIINRIGENAGDNSVFADTLELAKADILADNQITRDDLQATRDLITAVNDGMDAMKLDILADTQTIKDSLVLVGDNTALGDAIEQLRADLSAFADLTAANVDASTADRQRILDDIAYLREQAEQAAAEREQVESVRDEIPADAPEIEKLYAYLDEITARISVLSNISEDAAAAKDGVTATLDGINNVNDSVANIAGGVDEALGLVRPLSDDIVGVREDVAGAREASVAALDALTPISDQLNAILDRLDAVAAADEEAAEDTQSANAYGEELDEIRDGINTILDTLPLMPQNDDLIAARDNTYSILDTLTLMPQNDDITVTRDNVAAILDAVNALADSIHGESDGDGDTLFDAVAGIRADTDALLASIPEGFAEDLAVVRDNTGAILDSVTSITQSQEDIAYIRQKLDGGEDGDKQNDEFAMLSGDIGAVIEKLEAFEQNANANKQDIIDAVAGIREEIHINELDGTISAAGIDDETRDTLVTEISEIRERLASIESVTQSLTDYNASTLDGINARLADLQAALADNGGATENGEHVGSDIAESIEQIKIMLQPTEMLDGLAADIAEIRARLEGGEGEYVGGEASETSGESLQAIIDELSVIKERIDAESEYDTVAEILSLRDDIKASRIVDQNEVSSELEAIKNELAAISSGNLLDEVRALRDDVAAISVGGESVPTDGEINLVLNEIVSLRDEVFALKDEVLSATTASEEAGDEPNETADSTTDNINIILDELTALRADQGAITDNIDELKDIISRRTTLASEAADASETASNELNVVLNEIIDIKNGIERVDELIPVERLDAITAQVDELRAMIESMGGAAQSDEQGAGIAELKEAIDNMASELSAVDVAEFADRLDEINDAIAELRVAQPAVAENGETAVHVGADAVAGLYAEIDEIKNAISALSPVDVSGEIAELRAEVEALRAENEQLRQNNSADLAGEIASLRDAVHDMMLASSPTQTADGDTSYAALIEEIRGLKDQIAIVGAQPTQSVMLDDDTMRGIRDALAAQADTTLPLSEELGEIRDEIAQLRSLTTVTAESGNSAEVAAMRDEIAELRQMLSSSDNLYGLAEDVTTIRADVQTLKDEPDLGVINEILALRDEFQALREQIEDVKRIAGETDRAADDAILAEVQSLRDQLFAISMANVNDARSGETNYESYNNIILDEISSLRDQIDAAGSSEEIRALSDELAQIRASLDDREGMYDALAERVAKLGADATNTKILEELDSLRTELANQRDADLTTLNFMSEMAHLLERQNSYIAQNTGTRIAGEIESLKAELASTDSVAEEVAKLREMISRPGAAASDNDAILSELADLREELAREKPSKENELILDEIARLRNEVTALAENRKESDASVSDDELSDSLSDLKNQLNEIAGIVEPEKKPAAKPATKKRSTNKSGTRSGTKSSGKKKSTSGNRGRKPAAKSNEAAATDTATARLGTNDDIAKRISAEVEKMTAADDLALNPRLHADDVADQLDKLAQQVANKLVIDQLVEQLAANGVTDERVEEILRELPEELTTVAIDESSERVRQLANKLVVNKLRDRLNNSDDDSEE